MIGFHSGGGGGHKQGRKNIETVLIAKKEGGLQINEDNSK
jgi:hypothetical protein